jgi:putative copper export protein/mono/diheme cytochrome c family protein
MSDLDISLVVARWLLLAAELQVFGALLCHRLVGRFPLWRVLRPGFAALGVFGLVWVVLQSMLIDDPATPLASVALVLQVAWVGHVALLRAGFWLASLAVALRKPGWAILPAAVALGLHGAVGHAEASDDDVLRASMVLHLLAAGAWLGGLVPLRLALKGPAPRRVAERFAHLGTVCVTVIGVTAIIQSAALAGGFPGLVGTSYGQMLLVKLALFLALVAVAAQNRFVLTPRLDAQPSSLNRSLAYEFVMAMVLLGAAALLSSLPPGAHVQPNWPFPLRPSLDVMQDDDLRAEVLRALLLVGGGLALCVVATLHRWVRLAVVPGLVLIWLAWPSLALLLVPAEPTYYWQSESAGDAESVGIGRAAYAQHCVSCHGPGGKGDGPLAAGLSEPPADLTAPHLWEHSDGELYWWINHGMAAPDGTQVMPGLHLGAESNVVWNLIDFLHANNPNGQSLPPTMHHH